MKLRFVKKFRRADSRNMHPSKKKKTQLYGSWPLDSIIEEWCVCRGEDPARPARATCGLGAPTPRPESKVNSWARVETPPTLPRG